MDLTPVIETHRDALKRIVAGLVAMLGFGGQFTLFPQKGAAASGLVLAEKSKLSPVLPALPRRLHRAVLGLLRPAESATRRLVIVLARGLLRPPVPCNAGPPAARKTASVLLRTGVVRRPGTPFPPRPADTMAAPRPLPFPLLDPLRLQFGRRGRNRAAGVPRICIPGVTAHLAVEVRKPPRPDDPLDAGRLCRRLEALARALDDLPGQVKRLARWQARRDQACAAGRSHRVTPLRGGRPPGGRLARYQPDARRRRHVREVDEILAHAHALAHYALSPDTS